MAQDPYAPIRTLPRTWFDRQSRNNTFTYMGNNGSGSGDGSNDVWEFVPDAPSYGLTPEGFSSFGSLGGGIFGSKFGDVVDMGENRLAVKYQDPGKHKYDLLNATYSRPDANSDWVLEGDPTATRQASTFETFYKDPAEQFGKDFVLPAAAMYFGAQGLQGLLGAQGAGATAGATASGAGTAGTAGAAGSGIGTLGTIAPGSSALAPIASTGLASTAPAITASIPQIGGGLLAAGAAGAGGGAGSAAGGLLGNMDMGKIGTGLLDYATKNPQVVGGLIGGLTGATGGLGSSGGGEAPYTGPMPAVSRGNWQPRAQAQMMALPQFQAPQVTQGAQGSGLWRFLGGK